MLELFSLSRLRCSISLHFCLDCTERRTIESRTEREPTWQQSRIWYLSHRN